MALLVLDCDGVDVIAHELTGDVIRIGRASSNDSHRQFDSVSAARLANEIAERVSPQRLVVNKNGTQVNGASIAEAVLRDGNEIRFGCVTGLFRCASVTIDNAKELQISDEDDSREQIRVPGTQPIFCARAL